MKLNRIRMHDTNKTSIFIQVNMIKIKVNVKMDNNP